MDQYWNCSSFNIGLFSSRSYTQLISIFKKSFNGGMKEDPKIVTAGWIPDWKNILQNVREKNRKNHREKKLHSLNLLKYTTDSNLLQVYQSPVM